MSNGYALPAPYFFGSSYGLDGGLIGGWAQEQLLEMDARFTAALEEAFRAGLERRASARAAYRVAQGCPAVARAHARRLEVAALRTAGARASPR